MVFLHSNSFVTPPPQHTHNHTPIPDGIASSSAERKGGGNSKWCLEETVSRCPWTWGVLFLLCHLIHMCIYMQTSVHVCAFSALACYSFVLCVSMFPSVLVSFFFLQEKAFLAGEQVSFWLHAPERRPALSWFSSVYPPLSALINCWNSVTSLILTPAFS